MTIKSPTELNTTKGLTGIYEYLNEITNNWFSNGFLISIFMIVLIGYYKSKNDFQGAFAVAGFVTFIFALLMWAGGGLTIEILLISLGVLLIGIIFLLLEND